MRRVMYESKTLQSNYDQLKKDHESLQIKYDRLFKASKEIKEIDLTL
jgi:hypothetical protein